MSSNRLKTKKPKKRKDSESQNDYTVKGWGKLKLVEQDDSKYVKDPDYQYEPSFNKTESKESRTALEIAREKNKIAPKDNNGQVIFQNQNLNSYKRRITEGVDWNRNTSHAPKYDVNSEEAKAARASIKSNEANISEVAQSYGDRVSRGVEWSKNNPQTPTYDVNSAEAKAARMSAGEQRLDDLYKKTGFVRTGEVYRAKDLDKRLSAIENNESVKRTLNYTTRSDGSMSYSSKKDYEAAQKFINEQEAEYVKTYTDEFKNDAKYKLDEKISSFVNNKDWKKEYAKMGAQNKVDLMSNLTEAQIDYVKKQGLELENIANWSEDQMESVVKGLKNAKYMDSVEEKLKQEFRAGVNQRAGLAGYNKIVSRESEIAASMSKKMSGFKSVGKFAIGGALMFGLVSALSDSGGQQSNAQLYGQQPLY